jgi:X-X-X-Leu-X-X-Gly heptad repeat protein
MTSTTEVGAGTAEVASGTTEVATGTTEVGSLLLTGSSIVTHSLLNTLFAGSLL